MLGRAAWLRFGAVAAAAAATALLVCVVAAPSASAQPAGAKAAAKAKPKPKWKPKRGGKKETAPSEAASDGGAAPTGEKPGVAASGADAGTTSSGGVAVVGVEEKGDAGMKVYKFGPVEVEGRLKSPQIVYFLRRVRAEFAAGELGHRSFLPELHDTRRDPALK